MTDRSCVALFAFLAALAPFGCTKETTNVTAPTLSATCEARPASGAAPLPVSFLLSVAGAEGPMTVALSYGDGVSGSNPDTPHTYAAAGSYVASITVSTSTQTARCAATVTVSAGPQPTPSPTGNQPPTPVYKTNPAASGSTISGRAALTVAFNMCQSSDPEKDPLYFSMDFDGDGRFDSGGTTGADCRRDYTYPAPGTWTPRICLHDLGPDGAALHKDQCRTYTVSVTP
jgi:PKD repeat protein